MEEMQGLEGLQLIVIQAPKCWEIHRCTRSLYHTEASTKLKGLRQNRDVSSMIGRFRKETFGFGVKLDIQQMAHCFTNRLGVGECQQR